MSQRPTIDDEFQQPLVLPCSSRRRILRWVGSRFQLRNRRVFWISFGAIATGVLLSSGILMQLVCFPLNVMKLVPVLGEPAGSVVDWLNSGPIRQYIEHVSRVSPVDTTFRNIWFSIQKMTSLPGAEQLLVLLGVGSALAWLLLFLRLFGSPSSLSLDNRGVWLEWQVLMFRLSGPVIPWQDIHAVTLKKQGGDNSPDGTVSFVYGTANWVYRLFEPAAVGACKLSLSLCNLERLEQRHALERVLQSCAEPNTVQPDVLDVLSVTQAQSYTELWLQALSSPLKRQSLQPLPQGKSLHDGRYTIAGQLGVGGQGTAYLAITGAESASAELLQDPSQSDVVVKEFVLPLYVDTGSRKEALKKFLDEADLLKGLSNHRVVKLIDCFVEDHRGYVVLERIRGRSLRDIVLAEGAFTEGQTLQLLDQMIAVLSYLHSQEPPVVHRDFAPDNMILTDDGMLKLVDFNVAQRTDNAMTGTIVGKQSYVPPEQLRGMATTRSDIYALGASLYFLMTGQDPEPLSESHPGLICPHLSVEIDTIVSRMTRLDETERFFSVEEIAVAVSESVRRSV